MQSFAAQDTWQQIYKAKGLLLYIDRGVVFEQKKHTMLVWAKNVTSKKIVYTQYLVQCKPNEQFKIVNVSAKDKRTGQDIPMTLGEQPAVMHRAPARSPAEYVVKAICGQDVLKMSSIQTKNSV